MGWIGALLGAFFNALFSAINNWLSGQRAHADAVAVGQQTQATADANAQTAAANTNTQKVAGVVQAENSSLAQSAGEPASVLRSPDPDSRD